MKKALGSVAVAIVVVFLMGTFASGEETTAGETSRDGRFIAYNNGTVLDTLTGLMWAEKDNGSDINWQDAKRYCKNYRGGGYTDWRMPTQNELAGLYEPKAKNPNPPTAGCSGDYQLYKYFKITCCCPWASDLRGTEAAIFSFSLGYRDWLPPSYSSRVLPVR